MEINTYSKFEEFKEKLKSWLLIQLKIILNMKMVYVFYLLVVIKTM